MAECDNPEGTTNSLRRTQQQLVLQPHPSFHRSVHSARRKDIEEDTGKTVVSVVTGIISKRKKGKRVTRIIVASAATHENNNRKIPKSRASRFPGTRIFGKAWKNTGISGLPVVRFPSNGHLVFANHVGNHMESLHYSPGYPEAAKRLDYPVIRRPRSGSTTRLSGGREAARLYYQPTPS